MHSEIDYLSILLSFDNFIITKLIYNIAKYDFYKYINIDLYRKIIRYLRNINSYINTLRIVNERLIDDNNLRDYKLLYKNPRYYNSRIYNRSTSDEIAII